MFVLCLHIQCNCGRQHKRELSFRLTARHSLGALTGRRYAQPLGRVAARVRVAGAAFRGASGRRFARLVHLLAIVVATANRVRSFYGLIVSQKLVQKGTDFAISLISLYTIGSHTLILIIHYILYIDYKG